MITTPKNEPLPPKIHPTADVHTTRIGAGSTLWQFVVVLPGARIGRDCNICAQVLIENDVIVGDRATIKSGVQLWDGLRVEDDVFIGPNVTFTNDKFPRSKVYPDRFPVTTIGQGASIGGGGGYPARADHRRQRHGGRWRGRHERRPAWRHRGGQPGAHHRLRRGGW